MRNRQRLDASILHPEALKLKAFLEERMIDQRRAIEAVVVAYNRFLSPLWEPNKPIVSILGMGPSGAGKTFLAEQVALYFFEDNKGFTKIACAEYAERHAIHRLMGAPPSYVGYGDPPLLAQEKINAFATKHYEKGDPKVQAFDREIEKLEKQLHAALAEKNVEAAGALARQLANRAMRKETYIQGKLKYDRRPTGIILFDEFEKGHESLMHFLLEITENGKATLGDGSETDLTKFFVIMTSNIASAQIAKTVKGGGKIGFGRNEETASIDQIIYENAMSEAKRRFSTEFLNRVIPVVFRIFTREELSQIRDIKIARIEEKLRNAGFNVELIIDQKARDFVLSEALDHPENGAREIVRKVDKYIRDGIGNLIVSGEIVPGKHTKIFVELEESEGKPRIVFERENS